MLKNWYLKYNPTLYNKDLDITYPNPNVITFAELPNISSKDMKDTYEWYNSEPRKV